MRKGKFTWICVVVSLMLVSIGFAQERSERDRVQVPRRESATERPGDDNPRRSDQALEQSADEARVRAGRSIRGAFEVMMDAEKLTNKQVTELYYLVFPQKGIFEKSTRQRLMSFGL